MMLLPRNRLSLLRLQSWYLTTWLGILSGRSPLGDCVLSPYLVLRCLCLNKEDGSIRWGPGHLPMTPMFLSISLLMLGTCTSLFIYRIAREMVLLSMLRSRSFII